MGHAHPLDVGLDGPKESSAVAYVSAERGAEVVFRGPIGTRQCDRDPLVRPLQAKAPPLRWVSEAGPWGAWLSRDRTKKPLGCWVVAPSLLPKKPGDRVQTDRRDALPLARLMRAGALTPVDVPAVAHEAIRHLARAREAASGALKAAKHRVQAFLRRQDSRDDGRATWGAGPPQLALGRRLSSPPRSNASAKQTSERAPHTASDSSGGNRTATNRSNRGGYNPSSRPSKPGVGAN